MLPIFIPSRYRAGIATTPKLLDEHNINYNLVVHPSEYMDYKQYYKGNIISTYEQSSIANARQFILDRCYNTESDWVWMMDDDITKTTYYQNNQSVLVSIKD